MSDVPSILIVDDEPVARSRLRELLADLSPEFAHRIVGEAPNAPEALSQIEVVHPQIVLLDIQMPGMTGIELARHISARAQSDPPRPMPLIIFVTAHDEFAVDAFEVRAIDYLLKPVRAERLAEAVRRVRDAGGATEEPPPPDETIAVELGGVTRFVNRSDVRFAEAHGDYARLHTADGSHLVRVPLSTLEEQWSSAGFVRIHRRYLVALAHVDEVAFEPGRGTVRVGEDELTVSRRHLRSLRDTLVRRARPG